MLGNRHAWRVDGYANGASVGMRLGANDFARAAVHTTHLYERESEGTCASTFLVRETKKYQKLWSNFEAACATAVSIDPHSSLPP